MPLQLWQGFLAAAKGRSCLPAQKVLLEHTQAVNHDTGQQLKASPGTLDAQTDRGHCVSLATFCFPAESEPQSKAQRIPFGVQVTKSSLPECQMWWCLSGRPAQMGLQCAQQESPCQSMTGKLIDLIYGQYLQIFLESNPFK